MGTTLGLFGFAAEANVSTEELREWAVLDIANSWPVGNVDCIRYIYHSSYKG